MIGKNNLDRLEKLLENLQELHQIAKENEYRMMIKLHENTYFDDKKDVQKEIDKLVFSIAENLQQKFNLNEEDSCSILHQAITELNQDGLLPEFPNKKTALTEEKVTWYELAHINGLNGYCVKLASDFVLASKCEN